MIGCFEAEAAVLGCLLQAGPMVTTGFLRQLEVADFTDPRHRVVFLAMTELQAAGQPVDPVTVLGQLRRTGAAQSMTADKGAGVFLADLLEAPPSVGTIGHYLLIVLEHRVRTEVETAGARLQQVAGAENIGTVRDVLQTDVAHLTRLLGRLAQREATELSVAVA